MPTFDEPLELMTPFGAARCTERIDAPQTSFWVCWPKETNICFWFLNQEVRLMVDWSNKSYDFLPFKFHALPKRHSPMDDKEFLKIVGRTIRKSRTCESINCCQWPANRGRLDCPVERGGYDDAARDALAVIEAMSSSVGQA